MPATQETELAPPPPQHTHIYPHPRSAAFVSFPIRIMQLRRYTWCALVVVAVAMLMAGTSVNAHERQARLSDGLPSSIRDVVVKAGKHVAGAPAPEAVAAPAEVAFYKQGNKGHGGDDDDVPAPPPPRGPLGPAGPYQPHGPHGKGPHPHPPHHNESDSDASDLPPHPRPHPRPPHHNESDSDASDFPPPPPPGPRGGKGKHHKSDHDLFIVDQE